MVGVGHTGKNLLLAVFRLCRKLFIEKLAYRLGFHSKKTIEYIVNCSNHHLSWQISSIAYEALSRELVFVYLLECLGEKEKPIPNRFTEWRRNEVKNANYHLYYDVTFNLLLGLKCFRAGICRNNSLFALAGCQKVVLIMFIGNHMIFRDIIVNDMQIRVEAPDDIDKFIAQNESFLVSADYCRGE